MSASTLNDSQTVDEASSIGTSLQETAIGPEPSLRYEEQSKPAGGGWSVSIVPKVALEVAYRADSSSKMSTTFDLPDGNAHRYEIVGPFKTLRHLQDVIAAISPDEAKQRLSRAASVTFDIKSSTSARASAALTKLQGLAGGKLSPLHPIGEVDGARQACGVPQQARYFAYLYPAEGLEDELEIINAAQYPWASLLLYGGFAYLNERRELISVNALSMAPSSILLMLTGPYACVRLALRNVHYTFRLCIYLLLLPVSNG